MEQDRNRILELLKKKALMDQWFYENIVNKVKQITEPEYPNYIYYVDKNINRTLMEYDQKNGNFRLSNDKIWSYFKFNYSHNNIEVRQLIKDLVGEHYNLWDITPFGAGGNDVMRWGDITICGV